MDSTCFHYMFQAALEILMCETLKKEQALGQSCVVN